ncbi:MAG TPA: RNA polymerase subunit sigma-70 [Candidatus Dormibacteraeota bacterium]
MLLDRSADSFGDLVMQHRSELVVHCYRMLGTIDEAEDAVQEAFARAWRARQTFRRSISLRAWLYRIATNVCLDTIELRKRHRVELGLTVGPCPDDLLVGASQPEAGPEARYDAHESVSLAFLTVLQVLPPRQRAVLVLRDVLALHAAEVAALLELSVPAVNSALQRARATLRASHGPPESEPSKAQSVRPNLRLLERYVRAWESADVKGLVALLRDDAVLAMAPQPTVIGATQIGNFLGNVIFAMGPMRLLEAHANFSPAFGAYVQRSKGSAFGLFALLVIAADGRRVTRIDAFSDPRVLGRVDVPMELA